jgi:hypothetical protein
MRWKFQLKSVPASYYLKSVSVPQSYLMTRVGDFTNSEVRDTIEVQFEVPFFY